MATATAWPRAAVRRSWESPSTVILGRLLDSAFRGTFQPCAIADPERVMDSTIRHTSWTPSCHRRARPEWSRGRHHPFAVPQTPRLARRRVQAAGGANNRIRSEGTDLPCAISCPAAAPVQGGVRPEASARMQHREEVNQ